MCCGPIFFDVSLNQIYANYRLTTRHGQLDLGFVELFEGLNDKELGIFPNQEFHIELQQDAKPFHVKLFEVDRTSRARLNERAARD